MSDFDFSLVEPKLNKWLPTQINIDGYGVAEFGKPKGILKGPVIASIDETGSYQIDLKVEEVDTEEELPLGINQLLSGDEPEKRGNELVLIYPFRKNNNCVSLSIITDEGKLVAENFDFYSLNRRYSQDGGNEYKIKFSPPKLQFVTDNENPPAYWVMPLLNFISAFPSPEPKLSNHPLRIFLDGVVPEDLPEEKKSQAEFIAQGKNRLIVFDYFRKLAFIEGLPDYKDRVKKIENRESPTIITSVMVGEVGSNNIDHDSYEQWFPFILLDLLSFATGVHVGTPWIEFRDADGKLVSRFHGRFHKPYFVKGTKIIDEGLHRGTGKLLTSALHSPVISESYLRTVMLLTTRGGRHQQSIEDKFAYLCRAFETLCAHFGYKTQNLLSILDANNQGAVQEILSQAGQSLQKLIEKAKGDPNQKGVLQRIWGKITNVASTDKQFGSAVIDLLRHFDFPDSEIIDNYFQTHPRKDNITNWNALISMYRGAVIHDGYFNFRDNELDIEDIWIVIQHLHDILARIILTSLDYTGTYQPTVFDVDTVQAIDWVKADTLPGFLGYAKDQIRVELMKISVKLNGEKTNGKDNGKV